jgi:tellurium resistance protein TerD
MGDEIRCPKCGSTQITASNKGFGLGKAAVGGILLGPVGLLGGLIGSKKVVVSCLKCGHQWQPGEVEK